MENGLAQAIHMYYLIRDETNLVGIETELGKIDPRARRRAYDDALASFMSWGVDLGDMFATLGLLDGE